MLAHAEFLDLADTPWYFRSYAHQHVERYAFAASTIHSGDIVLDVACGPGFGTAMLAEKAKHVTGVDISEDALRIARSRSTRENTTFVQADATALPFAPATFDTVTCFETIEHIASDDAGRLLSEIHRVLKPDGRLHLSTPESRCFSLGHPPSNPFHPFEFTREELLQALHPMFKVEAEYGQEFVSNRFLRRARAISRLQPHLFQRLWRAWIMVCRFHGHVVDIHTRPDATPMILLIEARK